MAKRGNIFYTDKDFTDLEIQQEFGFPVIVILHDNNSVIKKISAFDENGNKTIYDFTLAATKDFVIQSIADAVAGLNDNVLELNSYSDFPQPGEVGNIYIALDVDQIFVWNTESQSYVQQSWDAYVIQQLQTNIASAQMAFQNLQNSKLDKPNLSINAIPFWHESGTFFNSDISYINGNIGIGLSGGATEKLEIGGRSKSDGQVFNETSSAILPREIKFKDGKFKAALADGVEKSVLLEGDVQNNILRNLQSNNINFCGFAPFGSAENAAVWTVTKITVAANGTVTNQTFTNVTWSSVPF